MKLLVRHVSIPMRYAFGHARATRAVADNIVVEAELADGSRGWGESVPRDYVTGERIATVFEALTAASARAPLPLDEGGDFASACRTLSTLDLPAQLAVSPGGPAQPAAACALELAVLDAFARREQRPLIDAVALTPAFAPLRAESPPTWVRQTLTIADDLEGALDRAGIVDGPLDLKVKLGFTPERDRARVAALRARFGADVDLRGDANAAWDLESARALLPELRLSSIEEPLRDRDLTGCAQLRREGSCVMLDESLCTMADAERALSSRAVDLFNLRLSKCGGIFGTLRLVARAEKEGLGWQLGCMVGETGILASLGRAFVAHVRGARYLETTVPTKSLETDLTDARLDHRSGTRLTPVPHGPGFGAALDPHVLDRYTVARLALEI